MNYKRIFPITTNFIIKNSIEFFKKNDKINLDGLKPTIYYLDAASYGNLGDQAISYAIGIFFHKNYPNYDYVEFSECNIIKNLKIITKKIKKDDIIVLGGGGNFGDLYPRYEAIRRIIIKKFHNQIIIFPQTIDYTDTRYGRREKEKSIAIYNRPNVIICAREKKSYCEMKKLYSKVILVPDIVFYLNNMFYSKTLKSKTIGICLRNDKESVLIEAQKKELLNSIANKYSVSLLDTISPCKNIDSSNRHDLLNKKMKEFANCALIVTDRLHGMIFSILNHVPCLFIDNSNKKISGVYDTIKNYTRGVYNISNVDVSSIMKLIELNFDKYSYIDNTDIYNKLKDLI